MLLLSLLVPWAHFSTFLSSLGKKKKERKICERSKENDSVLRLLAGSDPVFWSVLVNQGGSDILGMQGDFKPTPRKQVVKTLAAAQSAWSDERFGSTARVEQVHQEGTQCRKDIG